MRRAGILAVTLAFVGSGVLGGSASAASGSRSGQQGPLTFDQAKAQGKKVDWGPNCDTTTGRRRGAERLRAPVCRAVEGRRQRRRDRTGRHQGHDHRRALPDATRPAPADVLREHRQRREPGQGTRHHPGVRRLLLGALRVVRPQDRARHGEGERCSRRRRRGQGRRDQGRDGGEGVRVVRRSGPDQRVRRGARGARRAVRGRLPDRTAAALPRTALAVPVADARLTRAGE